MNNNPWQFEAALISQFTLDLYRASHEVPFRHFQEHALDLMKKVIAFDSAWWGSACAIPLEIHRLHLHNCDKEFADAYPQYMNDDFFREALIQNPGVTINMSDLITHEAYVQTKVYKGVGRRFKVEYSLGTLVIEPVSTLFEFITLWRHDPRKPFDEAERQTKQLLMRHLAEANRHSRIHHLLAGGMVQGATWALADDRAYLRDVSPAFVIRIRSEWPKWQGDRLPDSLAECVIKARPYKGREFIIEVTQREGFRFLEVRSFSSLERLAPRERDIAERYAQGKTYADIATELFLSPTTVRNQIARCFKKLGVNNKTELASLVNRRKSHGNGG